MELLQLKYFCDAAKTENFSTTASKYTVPPSAVSQSIKRLESELGCELFTRKANRIKLNPKGNAFYHKVRESLDLLDDAKKELQNDTIGGSIKVSIFINRRIVMQTVEKFSRLYPQVDIVTKYMGSQDEEDFDLIITDTELSSKDYVREPLTEEDIVLAIHKDRTLAKKESLDASDLQDIPFICANLGSSLHRITEEICSELGFSPRVIIRSDDPYYIRKCVELDLGVCLTPSRSWQGQFSDQILLKNIGSYYRTTYAYRNDRKFLTKSTKIFLEMLREEFNTIESR